MENVISLKSNLYIAPVKKTCALCGHEKKVAEFNKSKHHKHGVRPECRLCQKTRNKTRREQSFDSPEAREEYLAKKRRYNTSVGYYDKYFMKRFGVTYNQVRAMYDAQFGRCANRACSKEITFYHENENSRANPHRACVDHDHKTGKVRALLCMPCNTTLGILETKENIILGLMEYKTKHSESSGLMNLTENKE